MALAVDASTPAYAAGSNDPWVTASFTPPNDSLLVVVVTGDWFGGTPTITPTSTGLTFTSQGKFGAVNNGVIEVFTAPVGSNGGTARTVSVTTSLTSDVGGAKVYVVTDYYTADPVEAVGSNTGAPNGTNNWTPTVLTTSTDGCWVFGGAVNWVGGSLASTSTDVFEEFNDADLSVMVARKSAATSPAGAVTLNFDQVAAGTPVWTYGAIAIRPSTYVPPPVYVVSQGAAVSGTTSITTAAYGADWADGDLIVYTVASNSTTESNEPTVSGFTNVGTLNGGGGTQGAGTGNRRLTFFTKTAASGDDTTPTISLTSGNVMVAAATVLRKESGATWETAVAAFAAETTAGTSWSEAMTSDPGIDVDDVLLLGCAVRDTSNSTAEGVSATGATFDTVSLRTDSSSETGNDIALHVSTVHVSGGPNSAAPTRTATHSTSETGVLGVLRIRAGGTTVTGQASGSFGFTAAAQGIVTGPVPGQATASFGFSATGNGVPRTPGAAVGSFTFTATASGTGPQRFITDIAGIGTAQYFVNQAAEPFLIRGYVLWGLLTNAGRWGGTWQSDLEDAVDGLVALGCNAIYTESLGNTQNGAADNTGETWDGVAPFTGGDPAVFNETFWERTDYLFDLCEAAGLTVLYNVAYSTDLDAGVLSSFTTGDFTDYGTSLAARYKTRPNLVWMMGGDYFDTFNTEITALKAAIRAEGDTHLFGVQNYPETTSRKDIENNATEDTGTDNSEFNFVYSYNAIYWGIEYAYSEASPLPVMWGDGHFDQDTTADRKVMRDLTWWAFSLGSRGIIHGSEGTWAWLSGALANLTSETYSSTDMGGIWDLFTSFTNWHQLVPDTDNSFVTAGRGTKSDYVTGSGGGGGEYNSSDTQAPYVTASVTADGTLAVVYFPVDQTITVDDTELAAGYTVTWVDPISGATTSETPASTYSPTGNNSLGGPDWLLVFEASAAAVIGVAAGSFGFTGAASGVDRALGAAVAAFAFTATVAGVDRALGVATASLGFTAAAAGVDRAVGSAAGSFGFTATASGSVGTPPVTGTASGAFGFTASASGTRQLDGLAAAAFGFAAAASGVDRSLGLAVALFGFTGVAAGIDRSIGAAGAAFGFVATTAGVPDVHGAAQGSFGFTGAAQGFAGTPPVTGTATAVFGFTATAQGQPRTPGTASGGFGFTGTAAGHPRVVAVAAISFGFTGAAAGRRRPLGVAQALFVFTATANGQGATVRADSTAAVTAHRGGLATATNTRPSTTSVIERTNSEPTIN